MSGVSRSKREQRHRGTHILERGGAASAGQKKRESTGTYRLEREGWAVSASLRGKRKQASTCTHRLEREGWAVSAWAKDSEQEQALTDLRGEDRQHQPRQNTAREQRHSQTGEGKTGSISSVKKTA